MPFSGRRLAAAERLFQLHFFLILSNKNNKLHLFNSGGEIVKKKGKRRHRKSRLLIFAEIIAVCTVFFYCSYDNSTSGPKADSDQLRVASFNIQVFGTTKIGKADVMEKIVSIIGNFDVVAIQEVRSTDATIIPRLVDMLGTDWDYRISERLGRTSSKEQYALVFRKSMVTVDSVYQVPDPQDLLHREPFVCYCRSGKFDFSIINIHTDPDEVAQEVNALDDILLSEIKKEKDALLMGDLNASPSEFDELGKIAGVFYVVKDGTKTNVKGTATYDNILFIGNNVQEYLKGDVFNFRTIYNLSEDFALDISDHLPVYAVFMTDMADDDKKSVAFAANRRR